MNSKFLFFLLASTVFAQGEWLNKDGVRSNAYKGAFFGGVTAANKIKTDSIAARKGLYLGGAVLGGAVGGSVGLAKKVGRNTRKAYQKGRDFVIKRKSAPVLTN